MAKKNRKTMVVWVQPNGTCYNTVLGFEGTKKQAKKFANTHNYSGGCEFKDAPAKTPVLTFTCPNCKDHRLECVMEGTHVCGVERIDPEGNFEYGEVVSYADVNKWQCLICGFTLKTEEGDNIINNEDVVAWIKNCTPKKRG